MQLIRQSFKPLFRYLSSAAYREWLRVRRVCLRQKPGTVFTVRIDGHDIESADAPGFLHQYEAIFVHRAFDFKTERTKQPVIYCCGANVGLEIVYLKKRFPKSHIRAYEADKFIAELLRRNVERNFPENTEVIHAAVWTSEGTISFKPDGALGGKAGSGNDKVPALRLAYELLREPKIDLLLIDIEGAELEVLHDCREQLARVERIVVEWHSPVGRAQRLPELLQLLTDAGFRYRLNNNAGEAPFVNRLIENDFDAMVEIYAERIS